MSVNLLSDEEMKAFVEAAGKEEGERGLILRILLGTGVSAIELVSLRAEDFSVEKGYVSIRGGSNRERRKVPLAEPLRREIRDYIEGRGSGLLFGRPDRQRRTLERVDRLVRQTRIKAGIEQTVKAADIRWTVGRLLFKQGASEDQVGAFLGYKTEMTPSITSPAGILGLLVG